MPYELQSENESDLDFALKMYGQAIVDFHKDGCPAHYDNMCFWQEQVNHCAKNVANQGN